MNLSCFERRLISKASAGAFASGLASLMFRWSNAGILQRLVERGAHFAYRHGTVQLLPIHKHMRESR